MVRVTGHVRKAPMNITNDPANQRKWREVQAEGMVTGKAAEIEESLRVREVHRVLSCLRSLGSGSCRHRNLGSESFERGILSISWGLDSLPSVPTRGDRLSR